MRAMRLQRQSFPFLFLITLLLCAPASAQTGSKKPGDIYSKQSVRAVMQKVFEWQAANPVEIDALNNNLWARAVFYAGVMSAGKAAGAMARAAEELFVSQAAVSRQIRELEALIDQPLFERLHRRVVLTDTGRRLLDQLTRSFDEIDRLATAPRSPR